MFIILQNKIRTNSCLFCFSNVCIDNSDKCVQCIKKEKKHKIQLKQCIKCYDGHLKLKKDKWCSNCYKYFVRAQPKYYDSFHSTSKDLHEIMISFRISHVEKMQREKYYIPPIQPPKYLVKTPAPMPSAPAQPVNENLDKKIVDNSKEAIKPENECVICYEYTDRKQVLVPCGHRKYCSKCIHIIKECSICKAKNVKVMKIYD